MKARVFNDGTLTELAFFGTVTKNVVLLRREKTGEYITCRDMKIHGDFVDWCWGHYFSTEQVALKDFCYRCLEIIEYSDFHITEMASPF